MVETARSLVVDWAPYMHWSKVHPEVRWELTGNADQMESFWADPEAPTAD